MIRSANGGGDKHILYACTEHECTPPGTYGDFLLPEFQEP
jgi:hypothetical protein